MFVNPKTSTYEPKPAVFVVKEMLDAPLKERVYAEAVVDLLEFAMQPGTCLRVSQILTPFADCPEYK